MTKFFWFLLTLFLSNCNNIVECSTNSKQHTGGNNLIQDKDTTIYTVLEEMPRFPGCEDKEDKANRNTCANESMLEYLYKYLKIDQLARDNGIETKNGA